jgi:hypothetical protein
MAAAFIGILIGALVAAGTISLPTVEIVHAADSAAAALYALAETQLSKIAFLQENPKALTALLGVIAVSAPGIVAALVALAARSLGVLRSVIAVALSLISVWALISLPISQSLPIAAIAALVFFSAVFPAVFALSALLWAVVGFLAVDQGLALWARSNQTVNDTIASFIQITRIDSPDFWRIMLSIAAIVPFYGAISSASKAK